MKIKKEYKICLAWLDLFCDFYDSFGIPFYLNFPVDRIFTLDFVSLYYGLKWFREKHEKKAQQKITVYFFF